MSDAPPKRYRVFISYTGDDEALARYLALRTEAVEAYALTYRRDGRIGDDPDDTIEREIEASGELLILLTPRSMDRMYIGYEYGSSVLERFGSARHDSILALPR